VWVHCRSGYRAAIGASLLARAGRKPVLVDDDFSAAAAAGLPVVAAGDG
jgi:rhodanese-related sulfurtransferase